MSDIPCCACGFILLSNSSSRFVAEFETHNAKECRQSLDGGFTWMVTRAQKTYITPWASSQERVAVIPAPLPQSPLITIKDISKRKIKRLRNAQN